MAELELRKPAVAGSFYAGDSKSLNIQIEKCFLHKIGPGKIPSAVLAGERKIVGLISPHAGYMYSGPVAAHGFYKIALDGKPDTIIILGPNHRGFGADVSIMINGKWKTPLGELEIDKDVAESILNNSKIIKIDNKAHQSEHSIEVQLPFIQYIFGKNVNIIPICMTRQDINTDIEIARSICSSVVDKNILIIASSDFTHYEPQEYAKNVDKQAINAILEFNPKKLYDIIYQQNLTMCGPGPITTMLIACKSLGAKKAELLKYATSGDITGMYDQVVGYASIMIRK
ncbi:MAG: AmmeMemoRadiSam system protein B [Candidatus Atribacteria bacterium]|nr:AmmeMemoRadiSam system protein B [Candidatus Atribacteria bacterium]